MKNGELLRRIAVATFLASVEATTPKAAMAQPQEIRPVDPKLMNEAIQCVLTAKPGGAILKAEDYIGHQRSIVMVSRGKRYTIDATKSYPNSYTEKIPWSEYTATGRPYLQIYERPNKTYS